MEDLIEPEHPLRPIRRMTARGVPEHIRSDNGPEFIAATTRRLAVRTGVGSLYIAPDSP